MKKTWIVLLGVLSLAITHAANAQVRNEALANSIIAARQKNNSMLLQYTWTAMTSFLKDGNTKDTRIQQVSYAANGVPQYTLINDTAAPMPRGFLRRAVAENEKEEAEKYLKGLEKLVGQYTLPGPGAVVNFLSTANITASTAPDGTAILQTTGAGVVVPGDSVTFSYDLGTFAMRQATVTTTFDGHSVTLTATFRSLPSGLSHLQYATVEVPDKNLTVNIHNYDYVPNN